LTIRSPDRDDAAVPTSPTQLEDLIAKERLALAQDAVAITREEAEAWCALHLNDNWYELPLMLMARGYNEDCENFTEVGAESVYELEESGCYIVLPSWWDAFALWRRT
jgi:sulfur transfer complex TusBCD TusB component (DsrH family)